MYKFQKSQTTKIFNIAFEKPNHKYSTQFSEDNSGYKKIASNSIKCSISVREPKIWDEFLRKEEKDL